MSDPLLEASNIARSGLRDLRGVVNVKTGMSGPNQTIIDFTVGFPEGAMARRSDFRRVGAGNSQVILGPSGDVDFTLIRLPPLPANRFDQRRLEEQVQSIVDGIAGQDFVVEVKPDDPSNSGDEVVSWWPHVELAPFASNAYTANEYVTLVRSLYQSYHDRFYDASGGV